MSPALLTTGGTVMSGTNFFFSYFVDHDEKECKRHNLALQKFRRDRDEWNKDEMKQINKMLRQICEAKAYINNVD